MAHQWHLETNKRNLNKSRTIGALDKKKRFRKKFAKQNREEIQARNAKFDKEYWEAVRANKTEERSPLWKKWHKD